jgi:hypothetical protein
VRLCWYRELFNSKLLALLTRNRTFQSRNGVKLIYSLTPCVVLGCRLCLPPIYLPLAIRLECLVVLQLRIEKIYIYFSQFARFQGNERSENESLACLIYESCGLLDHSLFWKITINFEYFKISLKDGAKSHCEEIIVKINMNFITHS